MANRTLFNTTYRAVPNTDAINAAGAPAYALSAKHRLAQLAVTGCLNNTFYADAQLQLTTVLALAGEVDAEFIATLALYSRERAAMKDMPALLLAVLTQRSPDLLSQVFARVINNGKMLRNYVQIMRSGALGRKSLGTRPKRLVQAWLNNASDAQLIGAMIGQQPSLADVIKMVHPRPTNAAREALYAYVLGKPHDEALLPPSLQAYEQYKRDVSAPVPDVPFQLLTALPLDTSAWVNIAANMPWRASLMNLNTFERHGVLKDEATVALLASRLRDARQVARAKAYPYQILAAWRAAAERMPPAIVDALQDALEASLQNVPALSGRIVICPDVSGSMRSPVSGYRVGATSTVRCIDVAALVAAAVLKCNPTARVLPFENHVVNVVLNGRDTVLTNAEKLAAIGGGGTNCAAPLAQLNAEEAAVDTVVFVSDNQSWLDARRAPGTELMRQWTQLKKRNPAARMVCIDIQPYGTTQAVEQSDILNIGGFSDAVFDQLAWFTGARDGMHWVQDIEQQALNIQ